MYVNRYPNLRFGRFIIAALRMTVERVLMKQAERLCCGNEAFALRVRVN